MWQIIAYFAANFNSRAFAGAYLQENGRESSVKKKK